MRVKVGKSMVQEILDQRKIKVGKNDDLTVGISQIHNIAKDCKIDVGVNYAQIAGSNWSSSAPKISIDGDATKIVGTATLDLSGVLVGISGGWTKISGDKKITVMTPAESHVVGIYTSVTKGMWTVTAGGMFTLGGGVKGNVIAKGALSTAGSKITQTAIAAHAIIGKPVLIN